LRSCKHSGRPFRYPARPTLFPCRYPPETVWRDKKRRIKDTWSIKSQKKTDASKIMRIIPNLLNLQINPYSLNAPNLFNLTRGLLINKTKKRL